MLIQATLNGALSKSDHPAVPISPRELTADAAACVSAGAEAIHLHPRDAEGRESLDPLTVDSVVVAVRSVCGVPVGVTTGSWIEPDLPRRVALVRSWRAPDYASVNVSDHGSEAVMEALLAAGIGIEAGVWSVADAERLARSGLGDEVMRILIEPVGVLVPTAVACVSAIHDVLDRRGLTHAPRLQHGDGEATWVLLQDAAARDLDTRIGLEDTMREPDGSLTAGNAALVRRARALIAGSSAS